MKKEHNENYKRKDQIKFPLEEKDLHSVIDEIHRSIYILSSRQETNIFYFLMR